jgi:membrane protease YdiL (CAAX protease family)
MEKNKVVAQKKRSKMMYFWNRLPVILRALIIGYLTAAIGGLGELFIFANLKFLPQIPWMLLAAGLWLWVFWWYVNGGGWPHSTSEARRSNLRAGALCGRVWGFSILAGSLGLLSVLGVGFLTPRIAEIPREAFKLPLDFSVYPVWMIISILLVISILSGVAEEVGYRGYMLSLIQRRHGWILGTAVTGFAFFLDHYFSHAYATFAFLPFFMLVSTVHALLVYFTGSIRPSILLHAVLDFAVIPFQYGLLATIPSSPVFKSGIDSSFILEVVLTVLFAIAAVPAFRKLRSVTK